jgi:L-alanine-DL-glutamate epimerase-like enolase superfamily enzyme
LAIDRIEVFVTELPTRIQRTFTSGSWDTGAPKQLLGKPVLVRVFAGEVVGYGQIRPISPGHFVADTVHSVVGAITEIYGPLLLGRELTDLESIHELFGTRLAGNPAARAVLDIAVHDALGKAFGVPTHKLIGGCCQSSIPLEWSVSFSSDSAAMIKEAERAVKELGIRVLCLKAAGPQGWRKDVENFAAVRRALGKEIMIGVDPNTGWTRTDAISAMNAMRPMRLDYIEQPIDRHDLAGMAEIRAQAAGIPIMADESLFTVEDAVALAKARAVDVFCIKLYKVGGLFPARKIAAIAEANNIQLNCGGLAALSSLDAAAAAHYCASIPARRTFGAAEFVFGLGLVGPDPLIAENPFKIEDGCVKVPENPGLGVVIDERALERHTLLKHVIQRRTS